MSADIIDRRQRVAASLILTAVDFPVDMGAYSKLLLQAGRIVGKGATAAEASSASREEGLRRARAMIDLLLEEAECPPGYTAYTGTGECPVPGTHIVTARRRDLSVVTKRAERLDWKQIGADSDIRWYRDEDA